MAGNVPGRALHDSVIEKRPNQDPSRKKKVRLLRIHRGVSLEYKHSWRTTSLLGLERNRNTFSVLLRLFPWTHLVQGPQMAILIPEAVWPVWLHLYHQLLLPSSLSVQITEKEFGPSSTFHFRHKLHIPEQPAVTEDRLGKGWLHSDVWSTQPQTQQAHWPAQAKELF